jgi:hypothetical protein
LLKRTKFYLLIGSIFVVGCTVYKPDPYVPYNTYSYPPPALGGRNNEPTSLRCIDNSNIFVHCNEAWWWAGPRRGWIPTGGGLYPWPSHFWPNEVWNYYTPQQLAGKAIPIIPYPY